MRLRGTDWLVCDWIRCRTSAISSPDFWLAACASDSQEFDQTGPGEIELTKILSAARVWESDTLKFEAPLSWRCNEETSRQVGQPQWKKY